MINQFTHSIFVQNQHLHTYLELVRNPVYPQGTYTEKHHIIPECLFIKRSRKGPIGWLKGEPNSKDNFVFLTPADHYHAHQLLVLFTTGKARHKMMYALSAFIRNNSKRLLSSEVIQEARKASSLANIGNTNNRDKCYYTNGVDQKLCYASPGPEWTKGKLSKVRDWWNNGQQESMGISPGPDWIKGRLRRRWWTNGKDDMMSTTSPGPEWYSGRTKQIAKSPWNDGHTVKLATTCPGPGWRKGRLSVDNKWWHNGNGLRQLSCLCPGPGWSLGFGGDNWSKNTTFWHKNGKVKRSVNCPGEGWSAGQGTQGNQLNKSWYNNGVHSTLAHEPPGPDYVRGRLKKL